MATPGAMLPAQGGLSAIKALMPLSARCGVVTHRLSFDCEVSSVGYAPLNAVACVTTLGGANPPYNSQKSKARRGSRPGAISQFQFPE
jgi:hypothetical protein